MSLTETQETILDAVQSVIVREGVAGASLRQVAEQADVSLGLLSYHFDDKETLIVAAFERATNELLETSVVASRAVDDPAERVSAFLRASFQESFLNSEYLRLRIALWTMAVTDPGLAKIDAGHYATYLDALTELLVEARPETGSEELRNRAIDVVSLTNGLWLQWARFGVNEDLERGLTRCEEMALGES